MKIILHTRTPIHDRGGSFAVHEAGTEHDLPEAAAQALIAKGAAAAVDVPAKQKPAA